MAKGRGISIRWWFAALVFAVALPLLVLLGWMFLAQVQREQADARDAALRMARTAAAQIRVLQNDSLSLLQRMAERPAIRDHSGRECDSLFAIVDFFPQYANLFLFDNDGALVCSASASSGEDRAVSAGARTWLEDELRSRRMPLRKPMIRSINSRWVAALAIPVLGSGGTRHGTLVLIQLPEILGRGFLQPDAVVTIVDGYGRVIARSSGTRWVGTNASAVPIFGIAAREKEGRAESIGIDGIRRQYGFTHLPEIGWYIYVGIPSSIAMAEVRRTFVRGALVALLIIALLAGNLLLFAREITRPLGALAAAVTAVAAGERESVAVEGPREIAQVTEAFNAMIESRFAHERQIAEHHRQLRSLSDRLLASQEEERAYLAREIHDDLGQSLTALKMDVGGLLADTPSGGRAIRDRILRTLDDTVTAVQRLTAELRPPLLDDLGLLDAIESEARLFEERSGIECEISLPSQIPPLEKLVATTIYRIIQEALTNVLRHAYATRVELRMRIRERALLVEIRDDGRGITSAEAASAESFGMLGMRERATMAGGTLEVAGVEGRGTIVSVQIPIAEAPL
ncbi:MAG TPA: ATP-binding protein [Thermoanaerobaculia bacterium]|nr:ATP-binding protein [Thermoanaerobaculia bacterium]